MGRDILIIGGAGFIGSYLANKLSENNNVTVVDNLINGDEERLNDSIDFTVSLSFVDVNSYDYIFYFACSQISRSDEDVFTDLDSNAGDLLAVLEEVKNSKRLKKLIYASTCSVYGNNFDSAEETPTDISSIYAATKYLGENYCNLYHNNYGVPTNIVRFSNVYGYNQTPQKTCGVIGKFIYNAFNGEELTVIDGTSTRDYTFIEDAVEAVELVTEKAPEGELYNISTNKQTSIDELVNVIGTHFKAIRSEIKPRLIDNIKHRKVNNQKLLNLGWKPKYNIEEGIKKIIEREYSGSN